MGTELELSGSSTAVRDSESDDTHKHGSGVRINSRLKLGIRTINPLRRLALII